MNLVLNSITFHAGGWEGGQKWFETSFVMVWITTSNQTKGSFTLDCICQSLHLSISLVTQVQSKRIFLIKFYSSIQYHSTRSNELVMMVLYLIRIYWLRTLTMGFMNIGWGLRDLLITGGGSAIGSLSEVEL